MSITCTITKAGRFDEYGRPLTVAQSYTGTYDFVKSLVRSGYASVPNDIVFDDDNTPLGYTNVTASVVEIRQNGAPVIVISADAPSDSDGRPNGTIYIQTA